MDTFSDELRLAWVVLLNGCIAAAAWRFTNRRATLGKLQTICDSLLLYFLIQYVAVGVTGILGILTATAITVVALVLAAVLAFIPTAPQTAISSQANDKKAFLAWTSDHLALLGCFLFTCAFLLSYVYALRPIPPIATDALVYHLPMAVQWLQTHRLGIYPTWYWNPAASYSPQSGSMYMAWWMAPAGSDVFVRYVQVPALLFIFFLVARLCRLMGCSRAVSGLIATAATLSRPLFSETTVAKDDLYVTALVLTAVLALSQQLARQRWGPWRAGIALGLVLACKYTVLLACPVLLFMIDSPFRARWRWREALIVIAMICVLALPWYLRNILLTGNALFPVDVHLPGLALRGLFTTERDRQLRTAGGIWHMLSDTYHSLPPLLIVLLIAGWALALLRTARQSLRDPLMRTCLFGSVLTWALFLVVSPHHEVRYLFPLIVLLFVAVAAGLPMTSNRPIFPLVCAACVAIASVATTFDVHLSAIIAAHAGVALLIAGIGVGVVVLQIRLLKLDGQRLALAMGAALLILALFAYTQWSAYVKGYREDRFRAWDEGYPHHAPLWKWVDENLPQDARIAYANTFFIYPYVGFNFTRILAYAPSRKGVHDFLHFPRIAERLPGDLIVKRMTEAMDSFPDIQTWNDNLDGLHAEFLVVFKGSAEDPDLDPHPPELRFAMMQSDRFERIYEDDAGVVYRIHSTYSR